MSGRAMDGESQRGLKKEKDVRLSNIMAAKAIADAIRTSLGPRGMDKMIQKGDGEVDAVATCLSSKVIAQNSDARRASPSTPRRVVGRAAATVDLDRVKIVKQVGGTVDDTELVDGIVFAQGAKKAGGGRRRAAREGDIPDVTRLPSRPMSTRRRAAANAKIGLIQFCLSAPKTDMENSVVVSDYAAMDRLLREGAEALCKKVKKAGVTVLLIQKSILRDAYNDLSLHFLAKMGILVRGSNKLVLEEADRSLHDALCVVRSLVKEKFLVAGGGSAEVEASLGLADAAAREPGPVGFCLRAFADALEVVPYTLAENAGLNPIDVVTSLPGQHKRATFPTSKAPFSAVFHSSLRKRHRGGEADAGIDVKRGAIGRMRARAVVQPLLVNTSALGLATECICMILKIDDLVLVR
ncbi:chaperonin containing TCP1 subunit 4 [Aureococcus anophagefferens]|uniref:Chaperonin containing TCP1 subunit 4 n=1 Tax=Aureococcus anophagefferens TaxID=44056 RepID=A0ABR1GD49_AURAN